MYCFEGSACDVIDSGMMFVVGKLSRLNVLLQSKKKTLLQLRNNFYHFFLAITYFDLFA